MGLWNRRKQADIAKRVAKLVHTLHINVTDMIAGDDLAEVERVLTHAVKVLEDRAERQP